MVNCMRCVENETCTMMCEYSVCIKNAHDEFMSNRIDQNMSTVMKSNLFVVNKFVRFVAHTDRSRISGAIAFSSVLVYSLCKRAAKIDFVYVLYAAQPKSARA